MIKSLNCLVLAFSLCAFSFSSYAQRAEVPDFKKNENYSSVRSKLIKNGWKPFHAEDADTCSSDDERCKNRPEMAYCSGSGQANCKFLWKKKEQKLAVCTIGEVASFSSLCDF